MNIIDVMNSTTSPSWNVFDLNIYTNKNCRLKGISYKKETVICDRYSWRHCK